MPKITASTILTGSLTVIGALLLLEKVYNFFKKERKRESIAANDTVATPITPTPTTAAAPPVPTVPNREKSDKKASVAGVSTEKVSIDTIRAEFHLSRVTMQAVKDWMNRDMDRGLNGGIARSTVPMLPSFVPEMPTGEEAGTFIAMDLGGTNLRVMLMDISPDEEMKSKQFNTRIPDFAMHGTAEQLFDFIARCLSDFLIENGVQHQGLPLGFTFSYPCKQTSLRSARLLRWTKGFETKGVVNEDIVELLEAAIKRDGRSKVEVVALINDTVGTMVAAAYENRTNKQCHIGAIIATGTNASYMEKSKKVKFGLAQATEPYPYDSMVIDTEWGGFGDKDEALALKIMTPYDIHVDNSSEHPGVNTFDKLVAGKCMGEIVRLVLERLVSQKLLFEGILDDGIPISERGEPFFIPGSFPTKYISEILGDESWASDETKFVLDELMIDRKFMGTTDILLIQEVCRIVSNRSAKLAAAAISCLCERINEPNIYVGIDGSTYKYLPFFEHHVVENIKKLVPPTIKVHVIQTRDGSGKGAALIAAIVSRLKRNALALESQKKQAEISHVVELKKNEEKAEAAKNEGEAEVKKNEGKAETEQIGVNALPPKNEEKADAVEDEEKAEDTKNKETAEATMNEVKPEVEKNEGKVELEKETEIKANEANGQTSNEPENIIRLEGEGEKQEESSSAS